MIIMDLTREEVLTALSRVLRAIIEFKGEPAPTETVGDRTDPIKALGLESDDLVLVGCELTDQLGMEIPEEAINWVDDSTGHRRWKKLGEVADGIVDHCSQLEVAHG